MVSVSVILKQEKLIILKNLDAKIAYHPSKPQSPTPSPQTQRFPHLLFAQLNTIQ